MGYYLNPNELVSMFPMPSSVVDKHIKLASAEQLRVLLWSIRNTNNFDVPSIAAALKMDESTVNDALLYWTDRGVLCSTAEPAPEITAAPERKKTAVSGNRLKPGRAESARRGLECPEIAFILREAEQKLGRVLRQSEISTFVWLYDDQGMSSSLILMIVGYAVSCGRPNIGFIERTAVEWINDGVTDVETAESRLTVMRQKNSAWHVVETAAGIEHRSPSKTELDAANTWVNEWHYGRDVIRAAYEACVDATSKFSIPYIKKIMEKWHSAGVNTVDDIAKLTAKPEKKTADSSDSYMEFVNSIIQSNEED